MRGEGAAKRGQERPGGRALPRFFRAVLGLAVLGASACAGQPGDDETLGQTSAPLTAYCQAKVNGVGTLDVETQYLPHVVHCENGGAPFEALKAQAVAARSYLYYKLETSGAVSDGQGDQVYSCGSGPTQEQIQAVKETEGLILRYKDTTVCSFYVAGGAASPPACKGAPGGTESDVTYNEGLSGSNIHQTPLGSQTPTNYRNRGCMSQLGSRCLADEGKTFDQILRFYYGADIVIDQATGPCVTSAIDAGGGGGGGGADGGVAPPQEGGTFGADSGPADLPGDSGAGSCSCHATGRAPRGTGGAFFASLTVVVASVLRRRRRAR